MQQAGKQAHWKSGLSGRGIGLTVLASLLLAGGLATAHGTAISLACALLLFLCSGGLFFHPGRANLNFELSLPETAQAERSFPIRVTIKNGTRWIPNCPFTTRLKLPENKWLDFSVPALGPGESARLTHQAPPLPRGVHRQWIFTVRTKFPLGFFSFVGTYPVECQLQLTPRPSPPSELKQLGQSHDGIAMQQRKNVGREEEFLALRSYRPGDRIQRIHWATSSRGYGLTVRDVEWPGQLPDRCALIVHSCGHSSLIHPAQFERLLSLTAGIAFHFYNQGQGLEIFCDFENYTPFRLRRRQSLNQLLRQLAHAKRQYSSPPKALQRLCHELSQSHFLLIASDFEPQYWPELKLNHAQAHFLQVPASPRALAQ